MPFRAIFLKNKIFFDDTLYENIGQRQKFKKVIYNLSLG